MSSDDVLRIFEECGAILKGVFTLSSGLITEYFIQKARVFQYPQKTELLCRALVERVIASGVGTVDFVVSPALGGLIPGYETARHLGVPALWVERENGKMCMRRFEVPKNAKILVVEDVITTGNSAREVVDVLRGLGATISAAACLIDRSEETIVEICPGIPLISLAWYRIPVYSPDDLPSNLRLSVPVKPGSRWLS